MNTFNDVRDRIGLMSAKMDDISCLAQEILEEYFNKYNCDTENDRESVAWEYKRYAALYRLMEDCMYDIVKELREMNSYLNPQSQAAFSNKNNTGGDVAE